MTAALVESSMRTSTITKPVWVNTCSVAKQWLSDRLATISAAGRAYFGSAGCNYLLCVTNACLPIFMMTIVTDSDYVINYHKRADASETENYVHLRNTVYGLGVLICICSCGHYQPSSRAGSISGQGYIVLATRRTYKDWKGTGVGSRKSLHCQRRRICYRGGHN